MTETGVTDQEVLALIQQGQPLADLLKELMSLRKWKDEQLKAQRQDSQRMERMLSRICVSVATALCLLDRSHSESVPY